MQTTNLIIYFLCYAMFFILSWINKINNNQRLINDEGAFTSKPGNLIGSHIIGILWLGIVPLFFLNHSILNFLFGNAIPDAYAVFSFLLILLPAVIIIFRQSKNVTSGKTMSYENFIRLSPAFIIRYFIIRAVFIFVYELWFRGFLLFDCISWVGMPAAKHIEKHLP